MLWTGKRRKEKRKVNASSAALNLAKIIVTYVTEIALKAEISKQLYRGKFSWIGDSLDGKGSKIWRKKTQCEVWVLA